MRSILSIIIISILVDVCLLTSCNIKESISNNEYNFQQFSVDGKILQEGNLINNIKQGKSRKYYKNGRIKEIGYWKDDKQDSTWIYFFENGDTSSVIQFKNDMQNGMAKFYYPNGTISEVSSWANGKLSGSVLEYNIDGKVKSISYWKDGLMVSPQH